MPDPTEYDLVVIGAGPGGAAAAATAGLLGKRVAVVERTPLVGGAAVNTGTLPSKTMRETAIALNGARARALYGVDLSLRREATIGDLLGHQRAVCATEAGQTRSRLDRFGTAVVRGTASFLDPHTVQVVPPDPAAGITRLRGEKIVVAIGSAPVRPPEFSFAHPRVHDSDELLDLCEVPRSLAVLGAGVIGSEYACMFAVLGAKVTLIDGRDALLPFLDAELSAALKVAMTDLGITLRWNERVARCDAPDAGDVRLHLQSGGHLDVGHVLVCAGRESKTRELNPEAAGLPLAAKDRLAVNAHFQTAVPHIYAVGDVIGFPALASTSAEQGRVAACHACGSDLKAAVASVLPAGIFTIPEVSAAGLTEAQAAEKGIAVVVGRAQYTQCPRGKIVGDKAGFLKLVFARDDMRLLGVHVIGEQATEVVHVGLIALMTGGGAGLFLDTCFNYPTLGELYKIATADALIRRYNLGAGNPIPVPAEVVK
jgi:NAD(P) transhydrogenase